MFCIHKRTKMDFDNHLERKCYLEVITFVMERDTWIHSLINLWRSDFIIIAFWLMSHSLKHCMPQVVDWEQKIVSGPAHGLWTAEKPRFESCARNLKRVHLWRISTSTDIRIKFFYCLKLFQIFKWNAKRGKKTPKPFKLCCIDSCLI